MKAVESNQAGVLKITEVRTAGAYACTASVRVFFHDKYGHTFAIEGMNIEQANKLHLELTKAIGDAFEQEQILSLRVDPHGDSQETIDREHNEQALRDRESEEYER